VARASLKRKVGTLEEYLASIDPACSGQTAGAGGRANVRAGGLARIVRHFAEVDEAVAQDPEPR
jgi:hypothetical protein